MSGRCMAIVHAARAPVFKWMFQRRERTMETYRSFSWIYTTVLVYLFTHAHKTSSMVKDFRPQNALTWFYDMTTSLAYGYCMFVAGSQSTLQVDCALYWLSACISAFVFAELGEINALKFSFTPGFWRRMSDELMYTLLALGLFVALTVGYNLRVAARERRLAPFCAPAVFTLLFYAYGWWVAFSAADNASAYLHVHHAWLAGFLSFWYRPSRKEWSTFSLIVHGCLLGVFTEGLDFYGSVEMKIIETKRDGQSPRFHETLVLLLCVLSIVPAVYCARCFASWGTVERRRGRADYAEDDPEDPEDDAVMIEMTTASDQAPLVVQKRK